MENYDYTFDLEIKPVSLVASIGACDRLSQPHHLFNHRFLISGKGHLVNLPQIAKDMNKHASKKVFDVSPYFSTITAPSVMFLRTVEILWDKTVFVPHTDFFWLFSEKALYLRAVSDPGVDIVKLAIELNRGSKCVLFTPNRLDDDLKCDSLCYLIIYDLDAVKVVDVRRLQDVLNTPEDKRASLFPVITVKYTNNIEFRKIAVVKERMILGLPKTKNDSDAYTHCYQFLGPWPDSTQKDKNLTTNQIASQRKDLIPALFLASEEFHTFAKNSEECYCSITRDMENSNVLNRVELNKRMESTTAKIYEFESLISFQSYLRGEMVVCHHTAHGKDFLIVIHKLKINDRDEVYKEIYRQPVTVKHEDLSFAYLTNTNQLLVHDKASKGLTFLRLGDLFRADLHRHYEPIYINQFNKKSLFSSVAVPESEQIKKKYKLTIFFTENYIYYSYDDVSFMRIAVPFKIEAFSVPIVRIESDIIYFAGNQKEEAEVHIFNLKTCILEKSPYQIEGKLVFQIDQTLITKKTISGVETHMTFEIDPRSTHSFTKVGDGKEAYLCADEKVTLSLRAKMPKGIKIPLMNVKTYLKAFESKFVVLKQSPSGRIQCRIYEDDEPELLVIYEGGYKNQEHPTNISIDKNHQLPILFSFSPDESLLVAPEKLESDSSSEMSFCVYSVLGMSLQFKIATASGVPRVWSSEGDKFHFFSCQKSIGRLKKLENEINYEKTEVQLPITVDHLVADDKHLTVYGCDSYSNICRLKLASNFTDKSNLGDLLSGTLESYEKSTDQEEKRQFSQILGHMSHMPPKNAQEVNRFMFIMVVYLNDIDAFIYFTTNITPIYDLMLNFNLLEACIDNQHMREHIEYIIKYIQDNIDWLRYDHKWIRIVNRFFKKILNSERIGKFLSNQLTRSLIKSLLLVETKLSLFTDLIDKDATVALIYSIPQTVVEEKKIIEDSVKPLQVQHQYNAVEYSVFRTVVEIDMTKGTTETRNFFKMISKFPDSEIRDKYKALVYYKYSKLFKHVLLYAMLDWTNSILAYLFYGYFFGANWRAALVVPMWLILTIKVFFEVACIVADAHLYLTEKWNFYDILTIATTYFTSIWLFAHPTVDDGKTSKFLQWARLISMLLLMWRSITWFRVFKPTRYIVTMILAVFKEMLAFLIFLSAFILTFAYMWRMGLAIDFDMDGRQGMSFYSSLLFATDIIYGNAAGLSENGQNMTVLQAIIHSVGNIAIALALLNFLIAIISGVYDNISQDRDLYDVKELMVLINDFDLFWFGVFKIFGRPKGISLLVKERYLVLLPPENNDNIPELRSSLDKRLNAIDTGLKAEMQAVVDRRMRDSDTKLSDMIKSMNESLDQKMDKLEEKLRSLDTGLRGELKELRAAQEKSNTRVL